MINYKWACPTDTCCCLKTTHPPFPSSNCWIVFSRYFLRVVLLSQFIANKIMHIFVILVRSKSLHFHRRLSSKMVTNKEKGVEMRFDNGKHVLSSDSTEDGGPFSSRKKCSFYIRNCHYPDKWLVCKAISAVFVVGNFVNFRQKSNSL